MPTNNIPDMGNNIDASNENVPMDNEFNLGDDMNIDSDNSNNEKENIQKNIGKACEDYRNYQGEDKEELGKWISGMLDSLDGDSSNEEVNEFEEKMQENFIFTKKQINELKTQKINELFEEDEENQFYIDVEYYNLNDKTIVGDLGHFDEMYDNPCSTIEDAREDINYNSQYMDIDGESLPIYIIMYGDIDSNNLTPIEAYFSKKDALKLRINRQEIKLIIDKIKHSKQGIKYVGFIN